MTIPLSLAHGEQRAFAARIADLDDAAEFAMSFCERHHVERRAALRVTLVIEELFTNTVRHGYRREGVMPILVMLAIEDGAVTLLYEDEAPRYDPTGHAGDARAAVTTPVEARPVGGLGVHLIGVLAEAAEYEYADGRNRLWLRMRSV